ncbi:unnamed protein product [Didymodactylos carnosus]|uniref:Uncharacterized protein n=1 Tax=Didymodactylos carnosus TaxID=1234261 RepID=A0A814DAE5_9BILA|nr:unnamed protein product [Didymodactylos carnosus]CAF1255852.1 unnamed protein product [Didymodactylos carnosus]CAF3729746.1 unnamed protein product [Didymodactylos carnosus]CAF4062885.1 unnamed protein product [Didymodactylos carnosus]
MKKYREKMKKDKVKYENFLKKGDNKKATKTKLDVVELAALRTKNNLRQKKYLNNKTKRLINKPPVAFKSRQSFGKAIKKVNSALPKCLGKKNVVVQHIAKKLGLIAPSTHERVTAQHPEKLKEAVQKFYVRDDISYQLPRKRDTIVVKDVQGRGACSSLQSFRDSQMCNTLDEECMFSSCPLCDENFVEKVENKVSKGVVDGIGGIVKRLVWGAVLAGQTCRSAEDLVRIAKQKTNKITLIELTKNDIDASKNKLQNIFAVVKAVPETLKTHCIKVIDNKAIECFIV